MSDINNISNYSNIPDSQEVSNAPETNTYENYFKTTSENIHRYILKNYNLNVDKRFIITTLKTIFVDSTHSIKDTKLFSQTNTIFKLVFQMNIIELIKRVNLDESVDVVDNTSKYIKYLENEIKNNEEIIEELRDSYIKIKREIENMLTKKY
mgnify:CR=1 FL=1|jgi:hypothetical protein|tara:strand:- start:3835 stop:4290 length:456 start_codon:yes stop_codon:yes gene_type:complete